MKFNIITIFPEMFPGMLGQSLAGAALGRNLWQLEVFNLRDFAEDKHKTVDDSPYGGGNGMVMKPDVIGAATEAVLKKNPQTKLLYPSPRGAVVTQKKTCELATAQNITFLCGRYEGVDFRVLEEYGYEEISLGDFVLSGGEVAAAAMMDAILRLVPGVIARPEAVAQESFGLDENFGKLLEYPHYTRPPLWKSRKVPDVLLSGNHSEIEKWRHEQAKTITKLRRPDLLD